MSGGSDKYSTSILVDSPTEERRLLLPDTRGMIITTATLQHVTSLVGLRGNRTMQYTGEVHT